MASAAPVSSSLASEAKIEAPRKGVVVVGVGASPQVATWPVATAVYAEISLRPRVDDRTARVLAGEPVDASAPAELAELASLRAQVRAEDDAAARLLLAEIARRTRARAVALVVRDGDTVEVRVYDAAEDRLEATRHRAESTGAAWSPLLGALRARFASEPTSKSSVATAPTPSPPAGKDDGAKKGATFLSSPWFWGALGVAVAGGVAAWALTRDDGGSSPPVRIEWGAR